MKKNRLIAKGLTLVMVFAMMIPTPVLAKGSGSGKLVKSVTEYSYNTSKNRWQKKESSSFTYNKKNYPKEVRIFDYYTYVLGVPMNADVQLETFKYKFKGKSPKSLKIKNAAGVVVDNRKYKKGRLVSASRPQSYDWYDEDDGTFEASSRNYTIKYNKKGLATSMVWTYSDSYKDSSSSGNSNETYTTTFAVAHKKGVPSNIVASTISSSSYSDSDGNSGSHTDSVPNVDYTKFNKKGLTTESGYVEQPTNAQKAQYRIQYKTKKGVVTQATVFSVKSDGSTTPIRMYKFKYTKKKISKARYFNMINSIVGYHNAQFSWY